MFFNSISFLVFISVFFMLYFLVKGKLRLMLCLVASYIFYGAWDWRFLSLIVLSTCIDFFVGQKMGETEAESTNYSLNILDSL